MKLLVLSGLAALGTACAQPAAPAPTVARPEPTVPPKPAAQPSAPAAATPAAAVSAAPTAAAQPTQAATAVAAKRSEPIIGALTADPRTLDPGATTGINGREATRAVFDALIDIDEAGNPLPNLAERWEQPDQKTYVFQLRQGVKFHDGTAFDAEAVKAHFDYHLDPANKSLRRGEITSIDAVTVVDANTVRIALKAPFAAFLAPLADLTGFIESPTARQRSGADFGLQPVGTGPFKMVEYQKDVHTVLERNPDYWRQGFPKADRVTLRSIPANSTRLTEVRTGGVHITTDPPFQDVQALRTSSDIVLSEKPGFSWEYMMFNQQTELGGNAAFRQAFNWALDREAIHNVVYFSTGNIAYDPLWPGTPFHDPSYKPFTRDVAKATSLIAAAGLKPPVTLEIGLLTDPVKQKLAQVVQQNLEEIGVRLTFKPVDQASLTSQINAGDYVFDLAWGRSGYRPDPDQYISPLTQSGGSFNIARYSNPAVDQLLTEERASFDAAKRREIFRKLADLMNEDAVYLSYHYGADFKIHTPSLRGFVHRQDGLIRYDELARG